MAASDPETWIDQHGDVLYRYALARLRDPGAAEEVVQESLVAALQARADFRGEAAERTWLVGILRHKLADHLRRRCRDQPLPADAEGDAVVDHLFAPDGHWRSAPRPWGDDPATLSENREFWAVFARCQAALPARQAALFTMRTLEDADPEVLCQEFGVSATNLWVLLHRARTRLRACLEEHWFGARST